MYSNNNKVLDDIPYDFILKMHNFKKLILCVLFMTISLHTRKALSMPFPEILNQDFSNVLELSNFPPTIRSDNSCKLTTECKKIH